MSKDKLFIILQNTEGARPFTEAFEQENPNAVFKYDQPGMIRIENNGFLGITKEVVSELAGHDLTTKRVLNVTPEGQPHALRVLKQLLL